jgi:hypothetical protein
MLIALTSVIVHDLDIPRRSVPPFEANPPLIVDADAVLSAAAAVQSFKHVGRNSEAYCAIDPHAEWRIGGVRSLT